MSKDIKQATADKAEIIGEVFNLYRVFYNQKSNIDVAIKYIRERLDQKESIIFYIEDGDKCLGFTQLYPTFDSVNVRKKIVLYDLFVREESNNVKFSNLNYFSQTSKIKHPTITIQLMPLILLLSEHFQIHDIHHPIL